MEILGLATKFGSKFQTDLPQFLALVLLLISFFVVLIPVLPKKKLKLPPGPAPVPIFGNWLQIGDDLNHRNLADLAEKYGDILLLRMGQRNLVVVSSPDLAKEMLHNQGAEFGSRPSNVVFDLFTGKGQDIVFTVYGEHWKKMRRVITLPFFSSKVVQQSRFSWESEIDDAIHDLMTEEARTVGIFMRKRLELMMYNIMYLLMFSKKFENEQDPLFLKLKFLNGERSRLGQNFDYNYGDFIPLLRPFLRGYLKICKEVKETRLLLFLNSFLAERKKLLKTESGLAPKCAVDHLLKSQEKGEITEDHLLYIVENMNQAGLETTLWAAEWIIAELVNNPKIQQRVREELDEVLCKGNLITEPDIPNCPYLSAVVKESLRLHVPIPLLMRMNVKKEKIAGYDIPARTKILVNAWYLANNPEHWDEPEVFNPGRFMGKNMEASGNDIKFLPFGAGRRGCPGVMLAMPILCLVIGRLVSTFELLPPPGLHKLDISGKLGQFTNHLANYSQIVLKPLSLPNS